MRILLAEDDESVREGLADFLSELGSVDAVESQESAQELLSAHPYDLVVSDFQLTAGTFSNALLSQAQEQGVPSVVITGYSKSEVEMRLAGIRPLAVLTKPFLLEELETLVTQVRERSTSLTPLKAAR